MEQNLAKQILEKLELMDKRFEDLEKGQKGLDTKFQDFKENMLTEMDKRFSNSEQRMMNHMDIKFENYHSKMLTQVNDQFRLVVESIESLENRMAGRTERMEVRQAKLSERVEVVEADVSIIQKKMME